MSRNAGQVTTREALRGGLVMVIVLLAVVAAAEALLPRGDRIPMLDGRGQDERVLPCPTPREGRARGVLPAADHDRPVEVTSEALYACPSRFDGQAVVYEGEVVRAVLHRGDRAWVQLNDDLYALDLGPLPRHRTTAGGNSGVAVSISAADAARIAFVGSSRARGDRLLVQGTFLRADPADAGGPTIQAHTVEIAAVGEPISAGVTPVRIAVALIMAAVAAMMAATARRSRKR